MAVDFSRAAAHNFQGLPGNGRWLGGTTPLLIAGDNFECLAGGLLLSTNLLRARYSRHDLG